MKKRQKKKNARIWKGKRFKGYPIATSCTLTLEMIQDAYDAWIAQPPFDYKLFLKLHGIKT